MEISEFRKYINYIDEYRPSDIEDFKFMTDDELYEYQDELEFDNGNLSNWDHIRAFITMKKKLYDSENIPYIDNYTKYNSLT